MTKTPAEAAVLSPPAIEAFIEAKRGSGRQAGTLEKYRRDLTALYGFLPEDKLLTAQALTRWQDAMKAQGYSLRTINSKCSAVNRFLAHTGRRDLQITYMEKPAEAQAEELTRPEYLRLLATARALGKERLYLLVKVFGTMDLPLRKLPELTVEAAEAGRVGQAPIPAALRRELLEFAGREGLSDGPVFRAKNGQPMNRTFVADSIRRLGRQAGVPGEKASPRCLQRLYRATQEELTARVTALVAREYAQLLETEQQSIGWQQETAAD